jgi:hypothetical protein
LPTISATPEKVFGICPMRGELFDNICNPAKVSGLVI